MKVGPSQPAAMLAALALDKSTFAGLTEDELETLANYGERKRLRRGETLLRQGEPADEIHFVMSGRFVVEDESASESIAEISQGEPIGEIGFFAGVPRTYTVTAARDSEVLTITRERFDQAIDKLPVLRDAVIRSLASRLAGLQQPARRLAAPRAIAVIAAGHGGSLRQFVDVLRNVATANPKIAFVTAADLNERFGRRPYDDPQIADWVNRLESEGAVIIYVADEARTDWTEMCVRQADALILVADVGAGRRLNPTEEFAFSLHRPASRRLVILHEARSATASGTGAWLEQRDVFMHHHVCLQDTADVERIFRFLFGRAVGFVAGGGGALGSAHLGVYKAFCDAGANFDALGGTSVGAAMTACLAMGLNVEEIDRATDRIFSRNRTFTRFTFPQYGFLNHKYFDRSLRAEYGDLPIEDLWRPFFAISTNLTDRRAMAHVKGPVWRAVRASGSIPGLVPPYFTADGRMLVDGGLVDNLPLTYMKTLKRGPNVVVRLQSEVTKIYHVDYDRIPGPWEWLRSRLNPFSRRDDERIPSILDVIIECMLVGRQHDPSVEPTDILINPDLPAGVQWTTWNRHAEILQSAYAGATALIRSCSREGDPGLLSVLGGRSPV